MKNALKLALLSLVMMVSCTKDGVEQPAQSQEPEFSKFYASMESSDTRIYVDEDENCNLYWNAGDLVTIFDGNTFPLQYKFAGATGDNQGTFDVVPPAGYYSGNPLTANYAVYPYAENTTISYDGLISYSVPTTQHYAVNSFGLGANPMVAVTNGVNDKFLAFKNIGGCFEFLFYCNNQEGKDPVKVKSIKFEGNNGEKLAGSAVITAAYGEEPTMTFADDATTTLTLDCGENGVVLGDAENPTQFWIAVPAITFDQGFTITITDANDIVTEISNSSAVTINRGKVQPFVALELKTIQNNEIWYTATQKVDDPTNNDDGGFNVTVESNHFADGNGIITFSGDVTKVGNSAFANKSYLLSVILPNSVTEIGDKAFHYCSINSLKIPNGVTSIGTEALNSCGNLTSITIPDGLTAIAEQCFAHSGLTSIFIPENVTSIGKCAFLDCKGLTEITIPNNVTSIGNGAFSKCSNLVSVNSLGSITYIDEYTFFDCAKLRNVTIPASVTSIGNSAFDRCSNLTLYCKPTTPPTLDEFAFNPNITNPLSAIYVPAESVDFYKEAENWSKYATLISVEPTEDNVSE